MSDKVWTAEELEHMTPAEQDALFQSSLTTNLEDVPAEFLEGIRSRFRARVGDDELKRP